MATEYIDKAHYDALLERLESLCDYVFEQRDNGDYTHRGNIHLDAEARRINALYRRPAPISRGLVPRAQLDALLALLTQHLPTGEPWSEEAWGYIEALSEHAGEGAGDDA